MPKQQVLDLHPAGWESDPADEYFRVSTLDYCVPQVYMACALLFRLPDDRKADVVAVLKRGLEITLRQCRPLCGYLEKHPDGGGSLCFHKTKESTVEFHVQWLDGPEDDSPSFEELESRYFTTQALGDVNRWCVAPMTYGEKPEAEPRNRPKAAAFKATFIKGGLVFVTHHHHYANDVMGFSGELHQLADNCSAVWNSRDLPPWNPACLDLSRATKEDLPKDQLIDGPSTPLKHPDHKPSQFVIFHLPKSKAAKLRALATPADGSYWVSTYDACTAYIWRVLTKHRARLHESDLSQALIWSEAVDMRRRFHDPPLPARLQGNFLCGLFGTEIPGLPAITAAQVISEEPLTKLAWYIRQVTNHATQETMEAMLTAIAPIRDKTALALRTDSLPPLSNFTTDWRGSNPYEADFGFGKPQAMRSPAEIVSTGMTIVYPPRIHNPPAGNDEGSELNICLETAILEDLLADPEWTEFFDYRGVDIG
ncbi:uncharacterized protein E0L32_002428 [Thyridium curvatum]|uniref:Uncharacterized protein n=1 Tax=Thyridium curvatum TaxID=1093900 RepID=A0A507BMX2_9PEZI|nr:uncharacterized protein E0L32_002428 [Thyridium curvatum]TPX18571.1 hypothetical protein E0L32_002428 [Thyridium curvatum]